MEERFKEIEKRNKKMIRNGILLMIVIGIVFGSIAGVGAYQMSAREINFTPSNNKWKVNNVGDAIDDLLFKKVSNNYSEEEQVVGTWIDGKPLYQKTINIGALPNKNIKSVAHNIQNFGECISINTIVYSNEGFWRSLNMTQDNLNDLVITAQVTPTAVLVLGRKYDLTTYTKCYITIQYTKTTDSVDNN